MKSTSTRNAGATLLIIFLVALSLITYSVIISEFVLSYPRILLSFILPDASKRQLELAEMKLEVLEWQTRLHASALAFGALVFVWYNAFIAVLELLFKWWSLLSSDGRVANTEIKHTAECAEGSELQCQDKGRFDVLSVYVVSLLAVIIINDSLFNRHREPPYSSVVTPSHLPTLASPHNLAGVIQTVRVILSGAFVRFTSMASRAFPVCVLEVSALFLVLYAIGFWSSESSSLSSDTSDAPPRYASASYGLAQEIALSAQSGLNPYAESHKDEKTNLDLKVSISEKPLSDAY